MSMPEAVFAQDQRVGSAGPAPRLALKPARARSKLSLGGWAAGPHTGKIKHSQQSNSMTSSRLHRPPPEEREA